MAKQVNDSRKSISCAEVARLLPPFLLAGLVTVQNRLGGDLFLTGGTVRDLLLGRQTADIDLTVAAGGRQWAAQLTATIGGTRVDLGRNEDAARVVASGMCVDFSSFREGALRISEELRKRDITINSMGVRLDLARLQEPEPAGGLPLIDPVAGRIDLQHRIIRMTSRSAFVADPLRMVRVFRFAGVLDFDIDPDTLQQIHWQHDLLSRVASERVTHELDLLLATPRGHQGFRGMAESGLLWEIIPELQAGMGLEQPASHHLDVFHHCLEALARMEEIQRQPEKYFHRSCAEIKDYLQKKQHRKQLKWAALLHDVGKPVTWTIDEDRGGRITFYNHDQEGARLVRAIGRRLHWARQDIDTVAWLVASHMRPFHLLNVARGGSLSLKACLRLVRAAEERLPGLFVLSMADALAGRGEKRPERIESEVDELFARIEQVRQEKVVPVLRKPPLLTGHDLIRELQLVPGPVFRKILAAIEEARLTGQVRDRHQALVLAARIAGDHNPRKRHA